MFKNIYLLIACAFFILFGCKKDIPIAFSETNFTSENNRIVEVNIPLANKDNAIAESINSAIKNHAISALQIGEPGPVTAKSIEEGIEIFNAEFKNFANDFPESPQAWEAQIDGEVIFKTPEIISISLTSYINTGGAHGNMTISFLNFDATTGKRIENNQLFTDIEAFKTIAKKHFKATVEDKMLFDPKTFQLPENMGYSDDGVILLYNTYEIAPYSTGIIELAVPFNQAKPYLVFNGF